MTPYALTTLNHAEPSAFRDALGDIFEHAPWVAEAVASERPFRDIDALHQAMVAVVAAASLERKLELIRAHPDLAGKAARAGTLTESSTREQAGAGLDQLSDDEYERFQRLNEAYKDRFEFPFILAVKGHTKQSVLGAFETRLDNSYDQEIDRALHEIAKIARFRLEDRVTH
ncbi:MAG: 2-oxo-4-hydroxy-4-carboxy-5-ureidoimidazoline decarboxylase [Trueperaceae bacterium]|nr:2-oxo-4-hydroxy-4-carboxy-5-ureidoimidazoline decarboxylase [Trueperaceae bacterium]